jgi:glycosyltransferase involved in cell wall biosynthesis
VTQILLYTKSYPYGKGETFLEPELLVLSKEYDRVIIFPNNRADGVMRPVPNNVDIIDVDLSDYNGLSVFFKYFYLFWSIYVFEVLQSSHFKHYLRSFLLLKSYLLQQIYRSEVLIKQLTNKTIDAKNTVHYSYWTEDWALSLSVLKKQKHIKKAVSRVHGYDLFLERRKDNYIPFRHFQLKQLNTVTAVSLAAYNYLKNNYSQYDFKFSLYPLGIEDNGIGSFSEENIFSLVSCSNVINIKRVELVAEALKHITFPIKWVHFGDGNMMLELKEKVKKLPKNVEIELKGRVANRDILDFYKTKSVNLFIHLSITEGGIPVAIQEAASFGVPTLGCKIGGVSEIVNEETGLLIDVDTPAKVIAEHITRFRASQKNTKLFRESTRAFVLENFLAEKNHKKFINNILQQV